MNLEYLLPITIHKNKCGLDLCGCLRLVLVLTFDALYKRKFKIADGLFLSSLFFVVTVALGLILTFIMPS